MTDQAADWLFPLFLSSCLHVLFSQAGVMDLIEQQDFCPLIVTMLRADASLHGSESGYVLTAPVS